MDESSKAIVYALIQEELLDKGKTVLLISHDNTDIPIKSGIQYRIINQKIQVEKTW
jgi:ABC-type Mn2+/Zn2+ transport system ATPase subunit